MFDSYADVKNSISAIVGDENFARIKRENLLQDSGADFLLILAVDMKNNPDEWRGFGYLNSSNPENWDTMLYRVLRLKPGNWDTPFSKLVTTTKAIAYNWNRDLSELITSLKEDGIDIDDFFQTRTNRHF